ncbi:hypothetical protein CC78DRAFT_288331 [Lojkania enalia]|uniref:Uncharacterized protein n=1 Tax=Lojkania enalia TaxID=147567 RepID=A0A9P4K5E6_9PLEO|nr:hypothetical protein CC78DRAFT_288331 [Didymosphaeria enalia]
MMLVSAQQTRMDLPLSSPSFAISTQSIPSYPTLVALNTTYRRISNCSEAAMDNAEGAQGPEESNIETRPRWQQARLIEVVRCKPNAAKTTRDNNTKNRNNAKQAGSFNVLDYPPLLRIDKKGNLILIVGCEEKRNGPRKLQVSHDAVRRLSPIWASLIGHNRNWPPRAHKIRLNREDPDMLTLVMRIAHADFENLPKCLEFRQLLNLALISSWYQTNRVLKPFLPMWTQPFKNQILKPGHEEWLFIAYQFGYEEDLVMLCKYLTLNISVDEDCQPIGPGGTPLLGHFPEGCIRRILSGRSKLLQAFLHTTYQLVEGMVEHNTCQCEVTPIPGASPPLDGRSPLPKVPVTSIQQRKPILTSLLSQTIQGSSPSTYLTLLIQG